MTNQEKYSQLIKQCSELKKKYKTLKYNWLNEPIGTEYAQTKLKDVKAARAEWKKCKREYKKYKKLIKK